MCSTSSFLLRQRSENRWVQPGLLPQHGQPDGCILLVLWARASFPGAQPAGNKSSLLELGLGSPAVLKLFSRQRKGRGLYGFRAACSMLFGFSSRVFLKRPSLPLLAWALALPPKAQHGPIPCLYFHLKEKLHFPRAPQPDCAVVPPSL